MKKVIQLAGIQRPSDDQVIFRYMSIGKFINLIETSSLYFPCISKLKTQDKHEGLVDSSSFPFKGHPSEIAILTQLKEKLGNETWDLAGNPTDFTFLFKALAESSHATFFATCWHMAEHESILMWNRYAPGFESVAIQTTVGKLVACMKWEQPLRLGVVNYDPKQMGTHYEGGSECFYKHPLYKGENECRLIVLSEDRKCTGNGIQIKVDLINLVDRVFSAPDSESWFVSLVESFANRAQLTTPVSRASTKL